MKNILVIIFCAGISISCQETIPVDLNERPPRLVIDANIISPGNTDDQLAYAEINLSTTQPFFANEETAVNNAVVKIVLENGDFVPLSFDGNGKYSGMIAVEANKKYTLKVIYENEIYTATEELVPSVPLEYVEQINDGGFFGEDIELRAYFHDPAGVKNYYYLEEYSENDGAQDIFSDQFFDGNLFFVTFTSDELKPGDQVSFFLYGVDEQFYNFMSLFLQQSGELGGGPFQTQPGSVRGNIINQTNPDHFPFGYFHISEVFVLGHTVE